MPKFEISPGLLFATRESWQADPTKPRLGNPVDRNLRTHVIVHHTDTPDNDASPNTWENEDEVFSRMRRLQVIRPDLGLDVPYSFVAFLVEDNRLIICEGRGEDRTGAHTVGHNTAGIGISFAGDFENRAIDPGDIARRIPHLSTFLGWLKVSASHPAYGQHPPLRNLGSMRPNGRNVFFHKDFKSTDCPGKELEPHLTTVDFLPPP